MYMYICYTKRLARFALLKYHETSIYNTRVTCSCLAFQFIGCWIGFGWIYIAETMYDDVEVV